MLRLGFGAAATSFSLGSLSVFRAPPSSSSFLRRVSPLALFLHPHRLSCFGNFNPRDHKAAAPFDQHRLLVFDDCV
ncbi:hypothetical protein SLE2022_136660 [Rubroshorea leprosula]